MSTSVPAPLDPAAAATLGTLRTLIDNLPDLIYIKDEQCRYVINNRAHLDFLGVKRQEEVLGKTVADFLPRGLAEVFLASEKKLIATGEPIIDWEELTEARDGRRIWISTTKVPVRDANGRIIGLVGMSRDITERKLTAQRLKQTNEELSASREELIKVLDALRASHEELIATQLQLIQVEKMHSVGRLAAGVAHEVKNPLAVVAMAVQVLRSRCGGNDAVTAETLDEIDRAVQRADRVVRGMLDFSLPSALETRPGDLNAALEQALLLVSHELASTHVRVVRQFGESLPPVLIDQAKIEQVFINLLLNAAQAMTDGGTLICRTYAMHYVGEAWADRFHIGQCVVVAELDDSGPGISSDAAGRLFDPFFTTKPPGKGTGLGLSVSRTIVELHGGGIELRNRPGGGARASVMLKAAETDASPIVEQPPSAVHEKASYAKQTYFDRG